MRLTVFTLATLLIACASRPSVQPAPPDPGDPRIVMALRADSLILCEDSSPFALVEIAWLGTEPAPSLSPPDLVWSSSDSSIVVIDIKGQLKARKPGSTQIIASARWGELFASKQFPVKVLQGRMDLSASRQNERLICGK